MSEVKEWQAQFEKWLRKRRGTSRDRMIPALENVLSYCNHTRFCDFNREDAYAYQKYRFKQASATTVNYELAVARDFFYWLQERDLAEWNPFSKLKNIPKYRKRQGPKRQGSRHRYGQEPLAKERALAEAAQLPQHSEAEPVLQPDGCPEPACATA